MKFRAVHYTHEEARSNDCRDNDIAQGLDEPLKQFALLSYGRPF